MLCDPDEVEVTFLKRSVPTSDAPRLRWDWPVREDKGVVSVSIILCGPAQPQLVLKTCRKHAFYFREEAATLRHHCEINKSYAKKKVMFNVMKNVDNFNAYDFCDSRGVILCFLCYSIHRSKFRVSCAYPVTDGT